MPFCVHCGKPVKPAEKFCGACGKPISAPQTTATPAIKPEVTPEVKAPDATADAVVSKSALTYVRPTVKNLPPVETVKMIVPDLLLIYGFGRSDTFNLIITTHRSIFAKLTNRIKEQSKKKVSENLKTAKINPVFKWMAKRVDYAAYVEWYTGKTPEEVLNETPGNYAIDNTDIIDVSTIDESWKTEDGDNVLGYDLIITTNDKTLKFKTQINPENIGHKNIFDAYKN
jgi:hypothetical protein